MNPRPGSTEGLPLVTPPNRALLPPTNTVNQGHASCPPWAFCSALKMLRLWEVFTAARMGGGRTLCL